RAVVRWTVERSIVQFLIGNGNAETRAEHAKLFVIELLLLVGDVLALARLAQSIALDGLGKNDGGRTCVLDRGFESGVHLDGIVAAQTHARQLFIRQVLDHLQQSWIGAKQVLPEVRAALDEILLVLAVRDL